MSYAPGTIKNSCDKPNANANAWQYEPVAMPKYVARPAALPCVALRVAIKSMSGPGVAVRARQAIAKNPMVANSGTEFTSRLVGLCYAVVLLYRKLTACDGPKV